MMSLSSMSRSSGVWSGWILTPSYRNLKESISLPCLLAKASINLLNGVVLLILKKISEEPSETFRLMWVSGLTSGLVSGWGVESDMSVAMVGLCYLLDVEWKRERNSPAKNSCRLHRGHTPRAPTGGGVLVEPRVYAEDADMATQCDAEQHVSCPFATRQIHLWGGGEEMEHDWWLLCTILHKETVRRLRSKTSTRMRVIPSA